MRNFKVSGPFYKVNGMLAVASKHSAAYTGWLECREQFHGYLNRDKSRHFLFYSTSYKKSISFVKHAERILKLPEKQRVQFKKTTNENAILVVPGPFWKNSSRLQILTILLRAGQDYVTRSFWATALYSEYIVDTEYAFRRFIKGYTDVQGASTGWVDRFSIFYYDDDGHKRNYRYIDRRIKKPTRKRCVKKTSKRLSVA